ncbi:putative Ig domain-containing protein [Rhizobium fabae]|uniref:Uncharacterized protein n=1 Tax=Rhizobium fabae TaxID=573179 RepID=A0A7W6FIZ8_9HYPH|nr:putative Ig domain-containing protein [Rhizobium fabae]MBB3915562.1 hypothetical protein [Rhizobium fabae]RUM11856.1 hypothetical protein EFB14_15825 [Rhizobium fabae]
MKLIPLAVIGAALMVGNAEAGTQIVWRSSTTGAIAAPATTEPPTETPPPIVTPPSGPTLTLSYSGQLAVSAGASVSLSPVVSHGSGQYTYSYFQSLPLGLTFDGSTGKLGGKALVRGSYSISIAVTDKASGDSTMTSITLVVS